MFKKPAVVVVKAADHDTARITHRSKVITADFTHKTYAVQVVYE
jgi:hypothetical protein